MPSNAACCWSATLGEARRAVTRSDGRWLPCAARMPLCTPCRSHAMKLVTPGGPASIAPRGLGSTWVRRPRWAASPRRLRARRSPAPFRRLLAASTSASCRPRLHGGQWPVSLPTARPAFAMLFCSGPLLVSTGGRRRGGGAGAATRAAASNMAPRAGGTTTRSPAGTRSHSHEPPLRMNLSTSVSTDGGLLHPEHEIVVRHHLRYKLSPHEEYRRFGVAHTCGGGLSTSQAVRADFWRQLVASRLDRADRLPWRRTTTQVPAHRSGGTSTSRERRDVRSTDPPHPKRGRTGQLGGAPAP